MRCIVEGSRFDIPVQDMKDGDLAVITNWNRDVEKYNGKVVQRYKNCLILLGGTGGQAWEYVLTSDGDHSRCRVRLLEAGETIKLVE